MKPGPVTRRFFKRARGQAMVEYSFIAHAILIGGTFFAWPFTSALLNGLSRYYESIYWVLTSPVP
ncbi:MAG: hypothetical protein JNK82_33570 [Myxococcaceae bacterium]|nr:hypothetical protein [Myxococcaceae bacterium]